MAIVSIKKISVIGAKTDAGRILERLQRLGCVQVAQHTDAEFKGYIAAQKETDKSASADIGRYEWAIRKLEPFEPQKPGLFAPRIALSERDLAAVVAARDDEMAAVTQLEDIEKQYGELRTTTARTRVLIAQLTPFTNLNEPLERIGKSHSASTMLMTVSAEGLSALNDKLNMMNLPIYVSVVKADETQIPIFIACHSSARSALAVVSRDVGLTPVNFPGLYGSPADNLRKLNAEIDAEPAAHAKLDSEVQSLTPHLPKLRALYDLASMEKDRFDASGKFASTKSAFYMTGWAPSKSEPQIRAALSAAAPDCAVDFADPKDDEEPPTLLYNNAPIRPFESIIEMFSLPSPRGIDPSFMMAPFYICFFGMMVSDAGYGLVLGLLCTLIGVIFKPRGTVGNLIWVIALGGFSTLIWGVLYGGWFGVSVKPLLLSPMEEPLNMMILCLAIGVVHLITGMGISAYMSIKSGNPWDALFDQGFWLMLLFGLSLMVVLPGNVFITCLTIVGLVGILCTAGRKSPTIVGKAVGGLGALYGITGYLSDVLSYARLFGMGLATGVIGMVINTLCAMLMTNPVGIVIGVVILVFGHTFNLAINVLGAYVHSCRLQYIEFFSKFYKGGGVAFTPLSSDNGRFVRIEDGK